jgi:ribosomal protein S18 acetylase RimI-like enzyme
MDLLDVIAARIKIAEKLMLSCFVRNTRAVQFYRKRGYNVDECSPEPRILRSGEGKAADYLIMSKSIARRSKEP